MIKCPKCCNKAYFRDWIKTDLFDDSSKYECSKCKFVFIIKTKTNKTKSSTVIKEKKND